MTTSQAVGLGFFCSFAFLGCGQPELGSRLTSPSAQGQVDGSAELAYAQALVQDELGETLSDADIFHASDSRVRTGSYLTQGASALRSSGTPGSEPQSQTSGQSAHTDDLPSLTVTFDELIEGFETLISADEDLCYFDLNGSGNISIRDAANWIKLRTLYWGVDFVANLVAGLPDSDTIVDEVDIDEDDDQELEDALDEFKVTISDVDEIRATKFVESIFEIFLDLNRDGDVSTRGDLGGLVRNILREPKGDCESYWEREAAALSACEADLEACCRDDRELCIVHRARVIADEVDVIDIN